MRTIAYRRHKYRVHRKRWETSICGDKYNPMAGYYSDRKGRIVDSHSSTARVYLKRISNKRQRRTWEPAKMIDIYWNIY